MISPAKALARHGITYTSSEKTKSDIYLELISAFSSGRIRLLDHERLLMQLRVLQRRVRSRGRDQIDHPTGGHDDISNSSCGSLWMSSRYGRSDSKVVAIRSDLTMARYAEFGPIRRLYDS